MLAPMPWLPAWRTNLRSRAGLEARRSMVGALMENHSLAAGLDQHKQ